MNASQHFCVTIMDIPRRKQVKMKVVTFPKSSKNKQEETQSER